MTITGDSIAELTSIRNRLRLTSSSQSDIEIHSDQRQAAVMVVLRDNNGLAEILMIKRAQNPRDPWSGHLALPGGKPESADTNLRITAIRETHEEVGLNVAAGGEILGQLDTIVPSSKRIPLIRVTPFIAIAPLEYHCINCIEGETGAQPLKIEFLKRLLPRFGCRWISSKRVVGQRSCAISSTVIRTTGPTHPFTDRSGD